MFFMSFLIMARIKVTSFLSITIPLVEQQEVGRIHQPMLWECPHQKSTSLHVRGGGLDQASGEAAAAPCLILQILSPTLQEDLRNVCLVLVMQTSTHSMWESYADVWAQLAEQRWWRAAGVWGTCRRKEQVKTGEAAAQGCFETMLKL